jgi:hypothetical protein
MMGQPGTAAAVARARERPTLAIGWHVHLADSRPCTLDTWPWGRTPARAGFALGMSRRMRRLARAEIEAQWRAFQETGLPCRFVSGHHHLHVHPFVRMALVETLRGSFTGWVRWGAPRFFETAPEARESAGPGFAAAKRPSASLRFQSALQRVFQGPRHWPFATSTSLWGLDRIEAMNAREIGAVLPSLGEGLHEFMFHPRRIDGDADTRCLIELRTANAREAPSSRG